jgi:hypothetical protein
MMGATPGETTRLQRYPGSRPFDDTEADRRIFFGRSEEILALSNRILGARLILLFARSGVGKTSLLSAGVAPRLREHALLPVPILLTDFLTTARAGASGSPSDRVIDAMTSACSAQGLRLVTGERTGLWEFFKTSLIWQEDTLLTPVLVFDQFEEIFTLTKDRELRRQWAREIGSLLQNGYPDRLVERDSRPFQGALPARDHDPGTGARGHLESGGVGGARWRDAVRHRAVQHR